MTLWFWLILFAALVCITASSMCAFDRKWFRAFVCGFFAFDAFAVLATGWVS